MRSQRYIFPISLVISLGMHLLVVGGLGWYANRYFSSSVMDASPVVRVPEIEKDDAFGLEQGFGNSVDESSLINPQVSDKSSIEQAFLTREAPGLGGQSASPPVVPQPLIPPPETPVPAVKKDDNPLAMALKKMPSPSQPVQERQSQPVESAQSQSTNDKPAGLPAEQKDRDLDLSSEEVSIEIQAGKVVARKGRQVKLARPRVNLAGFVDTAEISFPATIKMKVTVDETGRVRNVQIVRSSGSSSIDQAYRMAIFESWFEPAKDHTGNAMRDVVDLALLLN